MNSHRHISKQSSVILDRVLSNKPIGHDLARHSLVRLNRIRTGYGRFKSNMNRMGLLPSASCECGAANQTAQHIASECPPHSCNGDLVVLDTAARNSGFTTCSVTYKNNPRLNARRNTVIAHRLIGLGLVDLAQTCCAGDCPRPTVVNVVANKRQITSPVDAAPSTTHLKEYKALLICTLTHDHGSRTLTWKYDWCLIAHTRRREDLCVGLGITVFVHTHMYHNIPSTWTTPGNHWYYSRLQNHSIPPFCPVSIPDSINCAMRLPK